MAVETLAETTGNTETTGPDRVQTRRSIWLLAGGLGLTYLLTWLGSFTVPMVAAMEALADGPSPYFVFEHAALLYLWTPLAVLAACLAFLAPGLLISLRFNRGKDRLGIWALKGFAWSVLALPLMTLVLQLVFGAPLSPLAFLLGLTGLCLASFALAWPSLTAPGFSWSFVRTRVPDLTMSFAVAGLSILLLSPKFYWEDMNGDGAHLFVSTLNYVTGISPFWPHETDVNLNGFPTLNAVLQFFPSAWFVQVFGETALSLRLVYILGLIVMAIAVMEAMRDARVLQAPWRVAGAVGAALLLYGYALAFNTSYDPYFADIALPMAREPLVVAAFLGFVLFALKQSYVWMVVFAALSYMAAPNGLILIGFWSGTLFLVSAKFWPIRFETIKSWPIKGPAIALGIIFGVVIGFGLLQAVLLATEAASFGDEYGATAILKRLRYISVDSWERFLYWILPCGIIPALALLLWGWQDRASRALTLACLFYFGFFYVQGYRILPHHFAPLMVLPLIVLWRLQPTGFKRFETALPPIAVATCAIAAFIITPQHLTPHRHASAFAAKIAVTDAVSVTISPEAYTAFDNLFRSAFPAGFTEADWRDAYHGAGVAWYVHAIAPKAEAQDVVYYVRRPGAPVMANALVLAEWEGWTLVTLNEQTYLEDRYQSGIPSSISAVLYVPRDHVFGRGDRSGDRHVFDLANLIMKPKSNANEPTEGE